MALLSTKDYQPTGHIAMIIPLLALIVVAAWVLSRPIVKVLGV